mmetsp:Transcript_4720/g.11322  ORF Transcript_4720/g.11322 Transcript_4720/m.11322 type:complete len:203 (+) Transcript_4720:569-1177(+)
MSWPSVTPPRSWLDPNLQFSSENETSRAAKSPAPRKMLSHRSSTEKKKDCPDKSRSSAAPAWSELSKRSRPATSILCGNPLLTRNLRSCESVTCAASASPILNVTFTVQDSTPPTPRAASRSESVRPASAGIFARRTSNKFGVAPRFTSALAREPESKSGSFPIAKSRFSTCTFATVAVWPVLSLKLRRSGTSEPKCTSELG